MIDLSNEFADGLSILLPSFSRHNRYQCRCARFTIDVTRYTSGSGLAGGVFREERGPFREKENFGQEIVITFPL